MRIHIPKLNLSLGLAIILLLTPLMNIQEVIALIRGTLQDHAALATPLYIKLLKDAGMLLLLAWAFWDSARKFRFSRISLSTWLIGTAILSPLLAQAITGSSLLSLAGLRWTMPFFLGAALFGKLNEKHINTVARTVCWLFFASFLVQIGQLMFASNYYGVNIIGLPGRVGGFFIIPATAAQFSCIAFMLAFYYLPGSDRKRSLVLVLTPISVLMAASAAGVIIMIIMILLILAGRYVFVLLPLLIVPMVLVWLLLPVITNRPDIYDSIQERGRILVTAVDDLEIVSSKFGLGTNSGVLLSRNMGGDEGIISDSFYIAVLTNTGLLGVFPLMFLMIVWHYWIFLNKRRDALCATAIWGMFALTTQITEAFPANFVLSLLIAYFVFPQQAVTHVDSSRLLLSTPPDCGAYANCAN